MRIGVGEIRTDENITSATHLICWALQFQIHGIHRDYLLLGTAIYKGARAIRTDIYQSRNATPGKNSRIGWCSLMVSLTNENFIGPVPAKSRNPRHRSPAGKAFPRIRSKAARKPLKHPRTFHCALCGPDEKPGTPGMAGLQASEPAKV
jgi:hypothetical protein